MLGILMVLAISWLLLFFIEKQNLLILGLTPPLKRLKEFTLGLLFFGIINIVFTYADTLIKSGQWVLNPKIDVHLILQSLGYHIKSVIFEELVFRGALLYILMKKLSVQKALFISALCFGVYHWFTYGIFGNNIMLMLVVLIITGSMGYVWAYCFYKTKSILLAVGLHLGWNFVTTLISPGTPYGELIFSIQSLVEFPNQWLNVAYHILKGIAPALLAFLFVRYLVLRENKLVHQF